MGNIVLLDELTINKIAAGEVIERPASVIKEMVENSIDAGANNITVEIKNGGISFIKVTDNGKGIAQDDLEIAFERHATSKIRSADDLDTVTSMGFRGEALASISAIANVEMISKTEEQEIGYRVVVEGGEILEKEEAGCRTGTTITVRNLFFNTPVRYKFLKKDYTESGYIEDAITRIALVNPNIAIKLINSGKTVIQTNGNGDLKSVIYSIYGKDISNGIINVNYVYEDIKIEGVIGKPEISRSNRSNQLFFVNKRYIKDKTLTAATEQAYKGLIPIGKFGFVVLNLEINPAKVDVNVHPAKLEVRFQEENKIFQAIYHAIKDTLLKQELVANTENKFLGKTNVIDRSALSFEERLKNLKDSKKEEKQNGGLFGFRKQNEKQIEQYTNEESKIKTNIIEELYNKNQNNQELENNNIVKKEIDNSSLNGTSKELYKLGETIDTSDVLDKLRIINKKNYEDVTYESEEATDVTLRDEEEIYSFEDDKKNIISGDSQEKSNNLEENVYQNIDEKNQIEDVRKIDNKDKQNIIIVEENNNTEENSVTIVLQEIEKSNIENNVEDKEKIEDAINVQDEKKEEKLNFNEMYKKMFGREPIIDNEKKIDDELKEKASAIDIAKDNVSLFEEQDEYNKPTYKFIGIIFNTYIILEIDKEMYILDQHAAHERILYENVKKNYYIEERKNSQMLLLPDVITLTHKEMEIAKENIPMFNRAGFYLEEFGDNTIKLNGVPTVCIDLDTKELFLETLDEINTVARTAKQEKEEKFIATVACKAAVKANMALTKEEVENLMDQLLKLPNPFTCPHGRPTVIKMSKYDIERKFARK